MKTETKEIIFPTRDQVYLLIQLIKEDRKTQTDLLRRHDMKVQIDILDKLVLGRISNLIDSYKLRKQIREDELEDLKTFPIIEVEEGLEQ